MDEIEQDGRTNTTVSAWKHLIIGDHQCCLCNKRRVRPSTFLPIQNDDAEKTDRISRDTYNLQNRKRYGDQLHDVWQSDGNHFDRLYICDWSGSIAYNNCRYLHYPFRVENTGRCARISDRSRESRLYFFYIAGKEKPTEPPSRHSPSPAPSPQPEPRK